MSIIEQCPYSECIFSEILLCKLLRELFTLISNLYIVVMHTTEWRPDHLSDQFVTCLPNSLMPMPYYGLDTQASQEGRLLLMSSLASSTPQEDFLSLM